MFPEDIYKYVYFQEGGASQTSKTMMSGESESEIWDSEQMKSLEARVDALEKGRVGTSVQICDLNSPKYSLKRPISLLVFYENGGYYAKPIDFDIFGEGEDEMLAISDLKEILVEYFENLSSSPSKLSAGLKAKLNLLKVFIKNET